MRTWQFLCIAMLMSAPAGAQTPPAEDDAEPKETADDESLITQPVLVTTSTRAPMPSFATERSENVVDDDTIRRRQSTSISDAFAEENGVLIQKTNRGAGTLIVRGLTGPENLIYFDGVRFNQSTFRTGPNQYLDTIDPWGLERIELVRGPGSVLYGTGAMGGVVQMFPHRLPDETVASSRVAFSSADSTAGANLEAGTRTGGFSGRAGVTFRRHGRLRLGTNGPQDDPFIAGAIGKRFLAQPYEEAFWRGALGYGAGKHQIRANYYGGAVSDAMRVDRVGDGEVRVYDNQDHLAYLTYELDGPSFVDDFRINASWHRTSEEVRRFNCTTVPVFLADADGDLERVSDVQGCVDRDPGLVQRQRLNDDRVDTFGSSFTGVTRVLDDDLAVTWGGDAYTDSVDSSRLDAAAPDFVFLPRDRGNFAAGSTYTTAGVFSLARYDVWSVGQKLLRAQAGARVENFSASAPDVTDELGDLQYSFTGLVGSAGVAYLVGTNLNAFLNWNQGFRAPNLQETTVLGDSGNFYEVPNPDLGPERSDTFELGAKIDWANALRLRPSLWVSLLSNRITREPTTFQGASEIDQKQVRQRVNRDSAYFYGADLGIETYRWKGASLYGNVAWIDGAIESAQEDPNFVEGPLHDLIARGDFHQNPRRLPPAQYLAGIRYEPDDEWYFTFFLQGAAAQAKLAPDDLADQRICEVSTGVLYSEIGEECPGSRSWVTFNARAGYRYEAMTLDVAAMNLTDERYRRHASGVPAPGFDLGVQLTLDY